jgi:hypothetical protein
MNVESGQLSQFLELVILVLNGLQPEASAFLTHACIHSHQVSGLPPTSSSLLPATPFQLTQKGRELGLLVK